MAESWQQWYPHNINKWNASASVQCLSDAGYRAYHNLIMAQFESEDGMLPNDHKQLAKLSRMGLRWQQPREGLPTICEEVMEEFESGPNGRVFNMVQYQEWLRAKEVFEEKYVDPEEVREKRSRAGRKGNEIRWGRHKRSQNVASAMDATRKQVANDRFTGTVTATRTVTEPEGSGSSGSSDSGEILSGDSSGAEPNQVRSTLPRKVIGTLPTNKGEQFPIYEDQEQAWIATYPAVDVRQQLREMKAWSDANPRLRKTKQGMLRFVTAWLGKEQDKAGRGNGFRNTNPAQARTDGNIAAAKRALSEMYGDADWPG